MSSTLRNRTRIGGTLLALLGGCNAAGSSPAAVSGEAGEVPDAIEDASAADSSYARVHEILENSCSYARCHSGVPIGAALQLERGGDYAAALIGLPACEYELMNRVEPYDPEHSWLIVKLSAAVRPRGDPYENYIYFEPDPAWDPGQGSCRDHTEDGTPLFGQRMPLTAPNMLPADELATLRDWIAAGARH